MSPDAVASQIGRGRRGRLGGARSHSAARVHQQITCHDVALDADGGRQVGKDRLIPSITCTSEDDAERVLDHDLAVGGGDRLRGEARVPRRVAQFRKVLGEWANEAGDRFT